VQRSLQLQMRKPSIETMGTVDCQQGMEGWYDAAVCGLVREVVGVYSVSSIMCVPEIGIRPLDPRGSGLLFFMFIRPHPYTCLGIECCLLVLTYVLYTSLRTYPWVAVTVADASVSASGAPAHPLVAVRRTPRYQRVRTSVAMSTGCVAMVGWR